MFRLIQQRVTPKTLPRALSPFKSALSSSFSTLQQVYPVTRQVASPTQQTKSTTPSSLSALYASTTRQVELTRTLFEISQMRIIPPAIAEKLQQPVPARQPPTTVGFEEEWLADSVLRKRRLKMKKHKLRKRRKAQRALRRKLKKD